MGHSNKEIGDRAYRSRVIKHSTQQYVSDAIGIAQSTYSCFESGTYDMPISQVVILCDILDVNLMWLIYGKKRR